MLLANLSEYILAMEKMERQGIDPEFAEFLIKEGVEDKNILENHERMLQLNDQLRSRGYKTGDVKWSEERSAYNLEIKLVRKQQHIADSTADSYKDIKTVVIGRGLIYSKGYQDMVVIGKKIFKYDNPPFSVLPKDKDAEAIEIKDKKQLLYALIEEGKKGLAVQRYKGLGEMNPEQLWQTTMNPDKRTILQVKVEDVVDTDEIFTVLMGEEVEPRREFIQSNALEVGTLDI